MNPSIDLVTEYQISPSAVASALRKEKRKNKILKKPVIRLGSGYYCYVVTDKYKKAIKFDSRKHVEVSTVTKD